MFTATSSPLWENLRERMAGGEMPTPVVRLVRGENAYSSGQSDNSLYMVEEGQVKTVSGSPDGKRCLLSICVEGEFFGELGILQGTRTETATAMKRSVLRKLSVTQVAAVLQDLEHAEEFALHLMSQLFWQQRLIANMVTMNCEQRLAVTLLDLAHKVGRRQGAELRMERRITHEELSEMVGTTRSRVGFFLKRFCDDGLLVHSGSAHLAVHETRLARYVAAV
ncbi:Crp/Fnr family transcriptional regulator [Streptomyces sp. BBFR51]|uniref:Crp/Fnr family transcriptional regulator n=1 Tax=Streptomyces sp. BBFR51 TaxID=3372856 RepID=UPI0037DC4062